MKPYGEKEEDMNATSVVSEAAVQFQSPPMDFEFSLEWYEFILSELMPTHEKGEPITIVAIRKILNNGLSKDHFDKIKELSGLSNEQLAPIIQIPERTLTRRKEFKSDESDRILRFASAFFRALDVLEEKQAARRWFTSPKRAFAGLTPLEMCDTAPGAQAVENLLGRLEHGVFS